MDDIKIQQFLKEYPTMSLMPLINRSLKLEGDFAFTATAKGGHSITDSYKIQIIVSEEFPYAIPKVKEMALKIPRDGKHHVNPDGSLCMGSPLRLLQQLYKNPDLIGFAEKCLVPYLYGVSYKLQTGKDFPFGELAHGNEGIFDDYMELFGLKTKEQVTQTLKLLGMKKCLAYKKKCPCNCGKRLRKCTFQHKLNSYRKFASPAWFENHLKELCGDNYYFL